MPALPDKSSKLTLQSNSGTLPGIPAAALQTLSAYSCHAAGGSLRYQHPDRRALWYSFLHHISRFSIRLQHRDLSKSCKISAAVLLIQLLEITVR